MPSAMTDRPSSLPRLIVEPTIAASSNPTAPRARRTCRSSAGRAGISSDRSGWRSRCRNRRRRCGPREPESGGKSHSALSSSSSRMSSVTSSSSSRGEKPVSLQDRLDRRRKIARLKLRGREIDAEANVMPLLLPQATLPAGGFHDPERDAVGDRGRIDDRHEIPRRDKAAHRGAASESAPPRRPVCRP